jgi:hypothetical protein
MAKMTNDHDQLKEQLRASRIQKCQELLPLLERMEPEQLPELITEFVNEIQPPEVVTVFSHWAERVRWVLENNGDYHHE